MKPILRKTGLDIIIPILAPIAAIIFLVISPIVAMFRGLIAEAEGNEDGAYDWKGNLKPGRQVGSHGPYPLNHGFSKEGWIWLKGLISDQGKKEVLKMMKKEREAK
ncbi:MAG: hypothetical protein PHE59_00135 [Patescibacteria group bacterium]|nr:hypothetical protein [Patescibacteria group bacterium]MDD5164579.1 hypothetical protein [Patescibacteria group bacterium]MDD5534334.1 hypothetical protein [Patescibacteria group bacterium]